LLISACTSNTIQYCSTLLEYLTIKKDCARYSTEILRTYIHKRARS